MVAAMLSLPNTLGLVVMPDERLRTRCDPVTFSAKDRPKLRRLALAMKRVMRDHDGVAIAAPQLGVTVKVIAVGRRIFCNPQIIASTTEKVTETEGCLSMPNEVADVARHQAVTIRYGDLLGKSRVETFRGMAARAIQHEMDHLIGVLMTDRVERPRQAAAQR